MKKQRHERRPYAICWWALFCFDLATTLILLRKTILIFSENTVAFPGLLWLNGQPYGAVASDFLQLALFMLQQKLVANGLKAEIPLQTFEHQPFAFGLWVQRAFALGLLLAMQAMRIRVSGLHQTTKGIASLVSNCTTKYSCQNALPRQCKKSLTTKAGLADKKLTSSTCSQKPNQPDPKR